MKNYLTFILMAGLTALLLSSTASAQKGNEPKEKKTSRHIKMMKIENGKKLELDTIFTNNDVFVWNGDTINPPKHFKKVNPSGFDKMQQFDVKVDHKDGKEKVMIIKNKGGKAGEPMIWHMDSDNDLELITEDCDSVGKKIVIRKMIKDGNQDHMIYFNDSDMKHFPPIPPVPPLPHMKMMKMQHSGQIINLNDPNIISYRKKEMSGGREKIEIIRKKSDGPENMSFDYKFDSQLMPPPPPPPPPAPGMIREFNDGDQNIKVIEKKVKVDGKEGKEIKVEVGSKEKK